MAKPPKKPARPPRPESAYNVFCREFAAEAKKAGKPYDMKDAAAAWKARSGATAAPSVEKKPAQDPTQVKADPVGASAPQVRGDAQGSEILAKTPPVAPPAPVAPGSPVVPPVPGVVVDAMEEYREFAHALHNLLDGVLEIMTDGAVTIDEDTMEDLNHAGARLIKKYDKSGFVAENGAELTYIGALGSVGIDVARHIKAKKARKAAQIGTVPPPVEAIKAEKGSRTDNVGDALPWGDAK